MMAIRNFHDIQEEGPPGEDQTVDLLPLGNLDDVENPDDHLDIDNEEPKAASTTMNDEMVVPERSEIPEDALDDFDWGASAPADSAHQALPRRTEEEESTQAPMTVDDNGSLPTTMPPTQEPSRTTTPAPSRRVSIRMDEGSDGLFPFSPARTTESRTSSAPYPWPAPPRQSHYFEVAEFDDNRQRHVFLGSSRRCYVVAGQTKIVNFHNSAFFDNFYQFGVRSQLQLPGQVLVPHENENLSWSGGVFKVEREAQGYL